MGEAHAASRTSAAFPAIEAPAHLPRLPSLPLSRASRSRLLSGLKRITAVAATVYDLRLLLLLLFLLLFELLLLLELVLLLLLRFFRRLLLAGFNIFLVLRGVDLLLLEALLLFGTFLRLLRGLPMRLVELTLEVRLLLIVRLLIGRRLRRADAALRLIDRMLALFLLVGLLVGRTLRRFGLALRLVERMLALLVFEGLLVARVLRGALRRIRVVLRLFERLLLVTLTGVLGALFVVERKLLAANVGLDRAHLVARLVHAMIDEERVVAVVPLDRELVVVFRTAIVELFLARRECLVRGRNLRRVGCVGGISRIRALPGIDTAGRCTRYTRPDLRRLLRVGRQRQGKRHMERACRDHARAASTLDGSRRTVRKT
ncbi:hypothetical protein KZJ38_13920 [Paraburkholderia edwinii]|uniref:Uncharacterized protein n=1 Tax=Paraburkholderia edwinii TaxID=2861782 RepID=A0ABX8UFX0_9BURK|nr:hypothetical protein KZJ38_13920 [Paraburkholderia edwinii]